MTFDFKKYCQHCVICNRAKPDQRGGASLQPLGIPEYPWKIVRIVYVTNLSKSGANGYIAIFSMVFRMAKMAHFVQCHKEITAEVSTNLLISIFFSNYAVLLNDRLRQRSQVCWKVLVNCYGKIKHYIKYEYCSTPSHRWLDGKKRPNYANAFTWLLCRILF